MIIWLTSDSHFNHQSILGYCHRPFSSIEEHDAVLIAGWNSVVAKTDTVYHLGDFTLGGAANAMSIFSKLNGKIRVLGYPWHHDKRWLPNRAGMNGFTNFFSASGERVWIDEPMVVLEDIETNAEGRGVPMILCHYPLAEWDRKHFGSAHAHGHSHGNTPRVAGRLDVGVDSAFALVGDYRPLRLEECVQIIRSWKGE